MRAGSTPVSGWTDASRFSLTWHAFKVTGAPELTPVEDIEMELEQRRIRDEQTRLMEANLRRECQEFVGQYVLGFRKEVAELCDQVIEQKGQRQPTSVVCAPRLRHGQASRP